MIGTSKFRAGFRSARTTAATLLAMVAFGSTVLVLSAQAFASCAGGTCTRYIYNEDGLIIEKITGECPAGTYCQWNGDEQQGYYTCEPCPTTE